MTNYGMKPYYLTLFRYTGGPNFMFHIFNPYAIEIPYLVSTTEGMYNDVVNDQMCLHLTLMLRKI